MEEKHKKFLQLAIPIIIGCIAFFVVCNPFILDVSNISWIKDDDQWNIYLGMYFFQQSPWSHPIGLNPRFGLDIGSSIAFSSGGYSLIAKLLYPFLQNGSQIIGIWYLVCFILQSILAWMLLGRITQSNSLRALGTLLFIFSPPMLFRLGMHPMLVAHFLILGALYLSLWRSNEYKYQLWWLLLLCGSLAAQISIFFAVGVLWIASLLNQVLVDKTINTRRALGAITLNFLVLSIFAFELGYFLMSGSSTAHFGFGLFRAHLLTLFDSDGWSYVLPKISTSAIKHGDFLLSQGTYEGFGYLGLGTLVLILICLIHNLFFKNISLLTLKKLFRKNYCVLFSIVALTIFSFSNNITFLNINLHIPLPEWLFNLVSVLRSSGRIIWTGYYLILFVTLAYSIKYFKPRNTLLILTSIIAFQVIDTSAGWLPIRKEQSRLNYSPDDEVFQSKFWGDSLNRYDKILVAPLGYGLKQANWLPISLRAAKNGLATNAVYQGRIDLSKISLANHKFDIAMSTGIYDPKSLYIIDDDLVIPVSNTLNRKQDLFARIDGFNVLAPGWLSCEACPQVPEQSLINEPQLSAPRLDTSFAFGKNGLGTTYLLGVGQFERVGWGWAYPENWGVWSEGRQAKLLIPYPDGVKPKSLALSAKALIGPNHRLQRVEIWVNNQLQKTTSLDKSEGNLLEIDLPVDTARNFVLIDLRFPDAISAKELGLGDDVRKLAIGLESGVLR